MVLGSANATVVSQNRLNLSQMFFLLMATRNPINSPVEVGSCNLPLIYDGLKHHPRRFSRRISEPSTWQHYENRLGPTWIFTKKKKPSGQKCASEGILRMAPTHHAAFWNTDVVGTWYRCVRWVSHQAARGFFSEIYHHPSKKDMLYNLYNNKAQATEQQTKRVSTFHIFGQVTFWCNFKIRQIKDVRIVGIGRSGSNNPITAVTFIGFVHCSQRCRRSVARIRVITGVVGHLHRRGAGREQLLRHVANPGGEIGFLMVDFFVKW